MIIITITFILEYKVFHNMNVQLKVTSYENIFRLPYLILSDYVLVIQNKVKIQLKTCRYMDNVIVSLGLSFALIFLSLSTACYLEWS